MKTTRRQQLRTNELAQSLAELMEFFRRNSTAVLAGSAGVILVLVLGVYWYVARVSARYQGWDDFYGSQLVAEGSPDARLSAFRAVAGKYKDPVLVALSWLKLGDACVQEAVSGTRSGEEVMRLHSEAANAYLTILNHYPDQTLAVAGAHFGLAFLEENQHRWEEARKHYQAVADDPRFAHMPHKTEALEAIKRLETLRQPVVFSPPPSTSATTQVGRAAATGPAGRGGLGDPLAVPPHPGPAVPAGITNPTTAPAASPREPPPLTK